MYLLSLAAVELGPEEQALADAWATVRAQLRKTAGVRVFDQWLKPMVLLGAGDRAGSIRLGLPSDFMTSWVAQHYEDRLRIAFRDCLPAFTGLTVETCDTRRATAVVALKPVAEPAVPAPVHHDPFDPRFTFDRFIVGDSNRLALNAAQAIAAPGIPRYSPLFLHSATGLGKTHLMHAIGHAFRANHPDASIVTMSAEKFMFEFVSAMRARDTLSFKARLRSADLLMIDDIQFIAGKEATQEEFFHTVNEVIGSGKRLVISADRSPHDLEGVEARILSRLGYGLVASIQPPEPELRRAILDAKLGELGDAGVPQDVIELLATRIGGNVRELEGALNRLVAYALLTDQTIDREFAEKTLADVLRGVQRKITIDDIQKAVAAHFSLRTTDLLSARRARAVARPRQIAMYLAKRMTLRSLPEIGRKFGGRDHSTVIHAVRRIEELRVADSDLDTDVRVLIRQLEG